MRVAELADLTGTTVRTVRYYHQLGLLPVPPERAGWRDYGLEHVARLVRIRVLAQAGIPLERVARALAADATPGGRTGSGSNSGGAGGSGGSNSSISIGEGGRASVVADLEAAEAAADRTMAELRLQRQLIRTLLARAREGLTVSPMPPRMVAFYDRLEAAATDETTRAAVRRERDTAELAFYRGNLPPETELLYPDADADGDALALAAFGRPVDDLDEERIEALAAQNVDRILSSLGPAAAQAARTVSLDTVHQAFDLMLGAEPRMAPLGRAIERHLIAAIERLRGPAG